MHKETTTTMKEFIESVLNNELESMPIPSEMTITGSEKYLKEFKRLLDESVSDEAIKRRREYAQPLKHSKKK